MPKIVLNEAKHEYTADGRRVPGVSSILRKVGQTNLQWVTEEGLERGRQVHKAVEFDIDDDLIDGSVSSEVLAKVEGFRKWRSVMGVKKIRESELHVFHPKLYYCGTLDLIAEVRGEPWLIDLKSGTKEDWHRLQLAGYALAYEAERGGDRLPRAGLYLLDGDFRWYAYRNPRDFDAWKACVTLANWMEVEA